VAEAFVTTGRLIRLGPVPQRKREKAIPRRYNCVPWPDSDRWSVTEYRLFRGTDWYAEGETHIVTLVHNPYCSCRHQGCEHVEAIIGQQGLVA